MATSLVVHSAPAGHWVGDGFPVRSLFSYHHHGVELSPFLLLDYASPHEFTPTTARRGVGEHPHRGFETVTIVYQGEVAHRDSMGHADVVGPGEVQWMTAGSGILHDEFHSEAFSKQGGYMEMVQLWVNLPTEHKMTPPHYQAIRQSDIPQVILPAAAGSVRVIAGEYAAHSGPARTYTPIQVWDICLVKHGEMSLNLSAQWHTVLVVLHGQLQVDGHTTIGSAQWVALDSTASSVVIRADEAATVLFLSGQPIDEAISGYGPFVMNTDAEIQQALHDYRSGQFGHI